MQKSFIRPHCTPTPDPAQARILSSNCRQTNYHPFPMWRNKRRAPTAPCAFPNSMKQPLFREKISAAAVCRNMAMHGHGRHRVTMMVRVMHRMVMVVVMRRGRRQHAARAHRRQTGRTRHGIGSRDIAGMPHTDTHRKRRFRAAVTGSEGNHRYHNKRQDKLFHDISGLHALHLNKRSGKGILFIVL